ncbi:hypothetical protein [Methylorubrum extorquens]|uniref:hypothetical protein n=1 Tax=Methylorubrum extorquens TaxID=408 RepID=UPI0013018C37|nr:hypothetical protein [Methylorubrum extorquens]
MTGGRSFEESHRRLKARLWPSLDRDTAGCGRDRSERLSGFALLRAGAKIDKFEKTRAVTGPAQDRAYRIGNNTLAPLSQGGT